MKANRFLIIFSAAVLIAIGLVVFLTLNDSSSAKVVTQPNYGMGDLHRFEAQGYTPGSVSEPIVKPYYGMGNLKRLEHLQETQFPR
jgi:hypothetical protein